MQFLYSCHHSEPFLTLPGELRIMIWKELLPEPRSASLTHRNGVQVSSLQVANSITKSEGELYSNRMITFHISPNPKRASAKRSCEHPRTDVLDPLGSLWCLRPRYHKPRKAEDQNMLSWEQLPYRKLKGVNFELLATDAVNSGELL